MKFDTRYHRSDTVNENAKFFVSVYGKETALKICNDSIIMEQDNPHAQQHWIDVKHAVEKHD